MKNEKLSTILLTIIILLIMGVLLFLGYKFFFNVDISNSKDLAPIKTEEIGKEKYQFLYAKHSALNNEFIFFKNNDVNINNINNQDVLMVLYSMLSKDDKNINGEVNNDCYLDNNIYNKDNYPSSCYNESFDKRVLEEQYKNYFSQSLKVNYTDFFSSGSQECFIFDNIYKCYLNRGNLTINNYLTLMDYDYAMMNNDDLEVYSYLLTIRDSYDKDYEMGIYSDSLATNRIDDLTYYNNEINGVIDSSNTKKIIEKYRSKITKYKSTFVKENKNYVWKSTEIVK